MASNILSVMALLLSAGSLYVAYLAYRRTGADRRLQLRHAARELLLLLDDAIEKLARARQSRPRVLAMEGLALSGNAQIFEQEAAADDAELKQMREKARTDFGEINSGLTDEEVENTLVDAFGMKGRAKQLLDKYVAAFAEDDLKRSEKRQAMHNLGNQLRAERTKPGSE